MYYCIKFAYTYLQVCLKKIKNTTMINKGLTAVGTVKTVI